MTLVASRIIELPKNLIRDHGKTKDAEGSKAANEFRGERSPNNFKNSVRCPTSTVDAQLVSQLVPWV